MENSNKSNKAKGGYIFLSHSHDDIIKVREIRNFLENDGFEPLCFYLKCLSDDSEIEDLIKREIDAREWFVFVNSENARKSKWVTLEREYITSTNSKKIITINIDDENSISSALAKITNNLRIFISSSPKDITIARTIKNRLKEKDYLAFFAPDSVPYGVPYEKSVKNAIIKTSKSGCSLVLISKNSIKSAYVKHEIELAIDNCSKIIPVLLGDIEIDDYWKYLLLDTEWYRLPETPTEDEIDKMINLIGTAIISNE